MSEILKTDHIHQYNQWAGVETLHPLAGFIDFSHVAPLRHARKLYGFHAVFLKDTKCGDMRYGRQTYDYQDGTLLFIAPGQVFGGEDNGQEFQPDGYILMFHPDLLRGTLLGEKIKDYTFFSYDVKEALHLSAEERRIVMQCFERMQYELAHPVDRRSRDLLTDCIKMFLDYCARFYDRQFITREDVNKDVISQCHRLLDEYFMSNQAEKNGLPTVQWLGDRLRLTPGYLSDLLKKVTGESALQHIHAKTIDYAKTMLQAHDITVTEIAYRLGFQYPQHFTRLFKRESGLTPLEYRKTILNP